MKIARLSILVGYFVVFFAGIQVNASQSLVAQVKGMDVPRLKLIMNNYKVNPTLANLAAGKFRSLLFTQLSPEERAARIKSLDLSKFGYMLNFFDYEGNKAIIQKTLFPLMEKAAYNLNLCAKDLECDFASASVEFKRKTDSFKSLNKDLSRAILKDFYASREDKSTQQSNDFDSDRISEYRDGFNAYRLKFGTYDYDNSDLRDRTYDWVTKSWEEFYGTESINQLLSEFLRIATLYRNKIREDQQKKIRDRGYAERKRMELEAKRKSYWGLGRFWY